MGVPDTGDEKLARRYGPKRFALWFDEEGDYRKNNERFWRVRRVLIRSSIWTGYDVSSVPLIPEWFGNIMDHRHAYRESGYPWIWCVVFGFPSDTLRASAISLVKKETPSGLVKIEHEAPDPSEYSLPIVGFLARDVYLTLEAGRRHRYDHWRGYESLSLEADDEAGLMEFSEEKEAEQLLFRRLALSVGRRLDRSDGEGFDGLTDHARELWALDAVPAAGAVAGTAMEQLLHEALPSADSARAGKATLNSLIGRVIKKHGIEDDQAAQMHAFREVRNTCAHAMSEELDEAAAGQLRAEVDRWLEWLEDQTIDDVRTSGPGPIILPPERPPPADLHAKADTVGREAAESITPAPMGLVSPSGETQVDAEGICGSAEILISTTDPLAAWLVAEGLASARGGKARLSVFWRTQSMERAVAYARAYVEFISRYEIPADYSTHID